MASRKKLAPVIDIMEALKKSQKSKAYEPSEEEITDYAKRWTDIDREMFANNLEAAQALYRKYPDWVTADRIPPEILGDIDREECDVSLDDDFLQPNYKETARQIARERLKELAEKRSREIG